MPNWCSNTIFISHKDAKMIEWLRKIGFDFNKISPLQDGLGEDYWDWTCAIAVWGSKWNIDEDKIKELIDDYDPEEINYNWSIAFETAWNPPYGIYKKLAAMGFSFQATAVEPGCGIYQNITFKWNDDRSVMLFREDPLEIENIDIDDLWEDFKQSDQNDDVNEWMDEQVFPEYDVRWEMCDELEYRLECEDEEQN